MDRNHLQPSSPTITLSHLHRHTGEGRYLGAGRARQPLIRRPRLRIGDLGGARWCNSHPPNRSIPRTDHNSLVGVGFKPTWGEVWGPQQTSVPPTPLQTRTPSGPLVGVGFKPTWGEARGHHKPPSLPPAWGAVQGVNPQNPCTHPFTNQNTVRPPLVGAGFKPALGCGAGRQPQKIRAIPPLQVRTPVLIST